MITSEDLKQLSKLIKQDKELADLARDGIIDQFEEELEELTDEQVRNIVGYVIIIKEL